ncbi:MAG: GGDEF domain-containing protein [Clostridia bacterium]|nr:GGDEF domain-containing protein [Clostridia bacterium]NCC42009.1 GGDEF domain-containing protein [Clostridia bacterium]
MYMKKQKNLLYLGAVMILVFAAISIFTFIQSNKLIEKGYLASEGSAAENFAVLTASNIHLSDEQVTTLKNCSYDELLASDENEALRQMMDNDSFTSKVDYAYVMIHLKKDEVKYKVSEETKSLFDAPIGTNLDIMWLLDVNVSESAEAVNEEKTTETITMTSDIQRYSYYIEEDAQIFGEAPTYIYNDSEWGSHICGYSPLYSTEGTYIGVVGVELQTHDFNAYRRGGMLAMGLLLFVSTMTLALLFLFLYYKYNKIQYDKIYTDSLTHIYNRSYYNNQFIKKMNALHVKGHCFALMIADIDWFKKVNDTFGHETGDQVLIELAEMLLFQFGKNHVVRFGGEEFVIGLWAEDEDSLRTQLNQLYQRIRDKKFSDQDITLSISLGCSYCYVDELNGWMMSSMLKTADNNLYEAKENGRKHYRIVEYKEQTEAPSNDSNV